MRPASASLQQEGKSSRLSKNRKCWGCKDLWSELIFYPWNCEEGKRNSYQFCWEKGTTFTTFITVYCYHDSILLLFFVVNLFLCLNYKVNFIISSKQLSICRVQYYRWSQASVAVLERIPGRQEGAAESWLVWFSVYSTGLQTEGSQVRFPVPGTYLGCRFPRCRLGRVWEAASRIDVSLSLSSSLPPFHSKKTTGRNILRRVFFFLKRELLCWVAFPSQCAYLSILPHSFHK